MQATKYKREMITDGMIKAAEAVFVCMAAVETIKPIVTGYQVKVLEEEKYSYSEKASSRRGTTYADYISNPDHTYMMSDEDFAHYMKRTREEQAAAGLVTESPEHCPLLVAEHNVVKAENLLMDTLECLTEIKRDEIWNMEHRREYIKISLKLLAPFVSGRLS